MPPGPADSGVNRRDFLTGATSGVVGAVALGAVDHGEARGSAEEVRQQVAASLARGCHVHEVAR